jgi:hypothetical protein
MLIRGELLDMSVLLLMLEVVAADHFRQVALAHSASLSLPVAPAVSGAYGYILERDILSQT